MQAHSNLYLTVDIERVLNSLIVARKALPGSEYYDALEAVAVAFGITLSRPAFRVASPTYRVVPDSGGRLLDAAKAGRSSAI